MPLTDTAADPPPVALLDGLAVVLEDEVVSAGVNSSWHSSFKANSSPAELVTAIGRHEKPSASVVRVTVFVSRVVVGTVDVVVLVTVV